MAEDFRGIAEPVTREPLIVGEPTDISIHGEEKTPISLWEKIRQVPYLVDHYQIGDIADKMKLKEKSRFISDFVVEEMKRLNYTDTKESFIEILSGLEGNLPQNLKPQEKIRVIEQLIRIIQKERILKEKKEWLLTEQG